MDWFGKTSSSTAEDLSPSLFNRDELTEFDQTFVDDSLVSEEKDSGWIEEVEHELAVEAEHDDEEVLDGYAAGAEPLSQEDLLDWWKEEKKKFKEFEQDHDESVSDSPSSSIPYTNLGRFEHIPHCQRSTEDSNELFNEDLDESFDEDITEHLQYQQQRRVSTHYIRTILTMIRMYLWHSYIILCFFLTIRAIFSERDDHQKLPLTQIDTALLPLKDLCLYASMGRDARVMYILCHERDFSKIEFSDRDGPGGIQHQRIEQRQSIGKVYNREESQPDYHVYNSISDSDVPVCVRDDGKEYNQSKVFVDIDCCNPGTIAAGESHGIFHYPNSPSSDYSPIGILDEIAKDTYISNIAIVEPCHYHLSICSTLVCASREKEIERMTKAEEDVRADVQEDNITEELGDEMFVTKQEQVELMERSKEVFYHAYHSYIDHAYPEVINNYTNNYVLTCIM